MATRKPAARNAKAPAKKTAPAKKAPAKKAAPAKAPAKRPAAKPAPKKPAPKPRPAPAPAPVDEGPEELQYLLLDTVTELAVEKLVSKGLYYEADGQLVPKNQVLAIQGKTLFIKGQKNLGVLVDIEEQKGATIYIVEDEDRKQTKVVGLVPGVLSVTLLPPLPPEGDDAEEGDDGEAEDDGEYEDAEDEGDGEEGEYDDPEGEEGDEGEYDDPEGDGEEGDEYDDGEGEEEGDGEEGSFDF